MKYIYCIILLFYFPSTKAFDSNTLSIIIKETQLRLLPSFYSIPISDNYDRRKNVEAFDSLCSTIHEGDTIFLLELVDREFHVANYASFWKNHNIDCIKSFSIYDSVRVENETMYCDEIIRYCLTWEKELLIKAGEEHIRYWTGRSEVIATRIIFPTKEQYDIDCFVFFDFESDDMKRIEKIGRTGTVSHRYNRRTV